MNTKALLLGAVASLVMAGSANAAHFQGWYISMEAGANWISDADVDNDTIDPTFLGGFAPTEASFDTGWAGMLSMGRTWGDFRTELELGYRANDLESFVVTGTEYTGGVFEEFSAMANLVYDWRLGERWSLALGAGVGADQIHYDNDSGFHTVPIHDTQWVFAWQLIAGLNFEMSERSALFVNYRYFNPQDAEFTEVDGFGDVHNDSYDDITKHTVTIGWRYDLIADESPTAPEAPVVEAPPPPPAAPKQFIVFFGFNKCNITAEADNVLGEAASAAKSSGAASIRIVGHTDTVGSPTYNQNLSECRADAAKANLVGKGISDSSISTSGKGESELMVQTGDGVKEPQNRRATVDLQ
jgi:OOP family OmpA-OmpF porin